MFEDLTSPLQLQDQTLGPVEVAVTADRINFYMDATGDDRGRLNGDAPPGFASVLLFAVADLFLYHPAVIPFTSTLLHLDQMFEYYKPIRAGSRIVMAGTITRVRERAGSYFVTFDATGTDDGIKVMRSVSTFVLSDQKAPPAPVAVDEPPVRLAGVTELGKRSASRHDLVRYAGATRDFNPLHWDHDVAVEAGLPGTVVHGLLMYAWIVQEAVRSADGRPATKAKVRFRSALHPGQQVEILCDAEGDTVKVELLRGDEQLVTGTVTVAMDAE